MILSASLLEHMDSLYLTGNEVGDLDARHGSGLAARDVPTCEMSRFEPALPWPSLSNPLEVSRARSQLPRTGCAVLRGHRGLLGAFRSTW